MTATLPNSRDNYSGSITLVKIDQRVAKSGAPYHLLLVTWNLPNGNSYTSEHFLNNEQVALIQQSESLHGSSAL